MVRLIIAFLLAWSICLIGVAAAWLINAYIQCTFISDCLSKIDLLTILHNFNIRGIIARGTILAIVITFIAWSKIRYR